MTDPWIIDASAGAPAYSAAEVRRLMAGIWQYGGRTLGGRQGVRPGGNALQTSIAGTTITVRAGCALVDPGLTTSQGPYWVGLPADETHTLTAAHATNPRKDITVLRVYDHTEDSSGQRKAQSEYIVGVAAGSPSEPAVPAGAFRLATIDVPADGGGSPVVTNNFPWAVAAGAVLPVRNQTERDALTSIAFEGMVIDRHDRDWLERFDGTAWRVVGVAHCSSTADRDSAITNPYNGQLAVTTDTGSTWVRYAASWIRPTGQSYTDRQATGFGTTTSTTYTSTLTGGTVAGVAFVAPPSGVVKITNAVYMFSNATSGQLCTIRVRTGSTVGSGTDVLADDDNNACANTTTSGLQFERSYLLSGLTPGSNYNVQQRVRVASGTGTFNRHAVIVEPA